MANPRAMANTIYRAYKQGELTLPKNFAKVMYHVAGMSVYEAEHDYEFGRGVAAEVQYRVAVAARFIWDGRMDLAQAVIDGKQVEEVTKTEIVREFEITQEMLDNPETYGLTMFDVILYGVGDIYTEERNYTDYVIK